MSKRARFKLICAALLIGVALFGYSRLVLPDSAGVTADSGTDIEIPAYSDTLAVEINQNIPFLSEDDDIDEASGYRLSELDEYGRCGTAFLKVSADSLPTEERGEIGQIKPAGWHTVKYDCVDGLYLYNRCHLLAYCLSGLNADERNLITGTRQFNAEGMLPYETQVVEYIEATQETVLYRVTPYYTGRNLIADGVLMEAYSLQSDGLRLCVFVYNVQDGITIDYATGESWLSSGNN